MKGRKRTSNKTLELRDSRHTRKGVVPVAVTLSAPDSPDVIEGNEVAIAEWDRVVPLLFAAKMISELDRAELAGYALAYSQMVNAARVIQKSGPTYKTSRGTIRERPDVKVLRDAMTQLRGFAADFGMTPSSRGRMELPVVEKDTTSGGDLD